MFLQSRTWETIKLFMTLSRISFVCLFASFFPITLGSVQITSQCIQLWLILHRNTKLIRNFKWTIIRNKVKFHSRIKCIFVRNSSRLWTLLLSLLSSENEPIRIQLQCISFLNPIAKQNQATDLPYIMSRTRARARARTHARTHTHTPNCQGIETKPTLQLWNKNKKKLEV
jgi:hypothetical protein